eukprot:TRINITY_DN4889_c0_g1_i1.p1 TRINITY_DN4889_c0_g1~~TRINITY_DN4889_c0_g1_i1.p1  ORF type:complete len:307 (+),score=140.54 TRINITY_DN4889_c0_g1_i1:1286-2206(+)
MLSECEGEARPAKAQGAWWRARDEETGEVIDVEDSVAAATRLVEDGKEAVLDLSYRLIQAKGLGQFSKRLHLNKSLTKVNLSCNMLEDAGAALFFGAIAKLSSIAKVDFSGNMVGEAGGKAFAECLKVNHSLEKVSLFHNELGNGGAVAIAEALLVNKTLHSLNLQENCITDAGASALVKAVEPDNNASLLVLWVKNNVPDPRPDGSMVDLLPDALKTKVPLIVQEEGLHYNHISTTVHTALRRVLTRKNPLNAPPADGGKGKKGKEKKKKKDDKEEARRKLFWTPPSTPAAEPEEVPPVDAKKKK